jgi:hypothetical protein
MKKQIRPISQSAQRFAIAKKRVIQHEFVNFGSEKKFKFEEDLKETKKRFKAIVASLPSYEGYIIISALTKHGEKILKVIHSIDNIRKAFASMKSEDRMNQLVGMIRENDCKQLKIELALETKA